MTYQQLTIVGNVGRDPELKYTNSGTAVTDFSVAVNSSYTSNGERVERTTWYRVTCWGVTAENVAKYLKKGRQVLVVSDRIEANAYLDKNNEPRASIDVTAREVRFIGGRESGGDSDQDGGYSGGGGSSSYSGGGSSGGGGSNIDEIPF